MLVQLTPKEIGEQWATIRAVLLNSLPASDVDEDVWMTNILKALMKGSMTCWFVIVEEEVLGVVTTTLVRNEYENTTALLINSAYSYRRFPKEEILGGVKALTRFAKDNKCSKIVVYTTLDSIKGLIERLGGKTMYWISLDI